VRDAAPSQGGSALVVGAGWSGLAAAVALADAGVEVTLIDAAPQAGGRARRVELALGDRRYALDNGQHLLIGAYRETLALMRRVGVDPARAFVRRPFALRYPDGFRLQAARLPAPLHLVVALLAAHGLSWPQRRAMLRTVARWKHCGWQGSDDDSSASLLAGQPRVLVERIWEPLCVAALNVRPGQASARVFLAVLRDSLGAERSASDLMLPRGDLSTLLPDAALSYLSSKRATVRLRCPAEAIARDAGRWRVRTRDDGLAADRIVLALPPARAAALLATIDDPALSDVAQALAAIRMAPIATVYLRYAAGTRLPRPLLALAEDPSRARFGQWVIDRGALNADCDGVFGVVVSAEGPHRALSHAALAQSVTDQLAADLALPPPVAARVIDEQRATIVPGPGLRRPPPSLPRPGLFLAGDGADSDYPSTIEGSVRSGLAAARAVLGAASRAPQRLSP
jgi:hydroxysqualene dehydroxylase